MKLHDFEPSVDTAPRPPRAVHREGSSILTCATCGCRLTARTPLVEGGRQGPDAAWRHFPGIGGRDARGCRVDCMDDAHRLGWAGENVA